MGAKQLIIERMRSTVAAGVPPWVASLTRPLVVLDLGASQTRSGQSPNAAQKLRESPIRRNACKATDAIPTNSLEFRSGTVLALTLGAASMSLMPTVLTVTDLTSTSYRLAGLAASIAGPVDG